MKTIFAKIFASYVNSKNQKWIQNPIKYQRKTFKKLIRQGAQTRFGKDHDFTKIKNHADFVKKIPIRDYEGLKPYVDKIIAGEQHVLWPGKPLYFAKTSGTTSGTKYIPITKASMPTHIKAARDALLNYIHKKKRVDFVKGKQMFLQGSPVLSETNGIPTGRLSGIVAHYVPSYLQSNRMPSWETNCIDDWETKVDTIIKETWEENMSLIAGIPSWVQMYFEKIVEKGKKPVKDHFKNFSLFVYGGVNFEPYRDIFKKLIGNKVDTIELFPASEGFFAYQDEFDDSGLLLLVNNGIFYEFVAADSFFDENPTRIPLEEVQCGVNYVMLISTTAGLWCYNLGDTVMFTSLKPYRIIVTGRIKHFISAFGEHVIGSEVEKALKAGLENSGETIPVREFTVAPQIKPQEGLPYHEWFIEFEKLPENTKTLSKAIDKSLQEQNIYYRDLIEGKILRSLKITPIAKEGFKSYMKSIGKLGGQNKVPRLSNDRKIADELCYFAIRG